MGMKDLNKLTHDGSTQSYKDENSSQINAQIQCKVSYNPHRTLWHFITQLLKTLQESLEQAR